MKMMHEFVNEQKWVMRGPKIITAISYINHYNTLSQYWFSRAMRFEEQVDSKEKKIRLTLTFTLGYKLASLSRTLVK